jgi:hypothetical protein
MSLPPIAWACVIYLLQLSNGMMRVVIRFSPKFCRFWLSFLGCHGAWSASLAARRRNVSDDPARGGPIGIRFLLVPRGRLEKSTDARQGKSPCEKGYHRAGAYGGRLPRMRRRAVTIPEAANCREFGFSSKTREVPTPTQRASRAANTRT